LGGKLSALRGNVEISRLDSIRLNDLSVDRLKLDALRDRPTLRIAEDEEAVIHVLTGTLMLEVSGDWGKRTIRSIGNRQNVFDHLPTAVTLQPGTKAVVVAQSRYADCLLIRVRLENGRHPSVPSIVRPEDVQVHDIGKGHYQREVRECVGGHGITERIRVGETINPTGLWSSWPHHDFDANPELAPQFEEVFLYFTDPKEGWGLQVRDGLMCDGSKVQDVVRVNNGDWLPMPLGNHPVVAGVDCRLMYVWAYVSPIAKKYAKFAEDMGGYA
jgi:5-deoxy-glucuronate isomerase